MKLAWKPASDAVIEGGPIGGQALLALVERCLFGDEGRYTECRVANGTADREVSGSL